MDENSRKMFFKIMTIYYALTFLKVLLNCSNIFYKIGHKGYLLSATNRRYKMNNNDTFKVVKLLQDLSNSLRGNTNIYDSQYVDNVKSRLPQIENAFYELKKYFDQQN